MSEGAVDGALITINEKVFFIPRDELRNYRLPEDAAAQALQQIDEHSSEVEGYASGTGQLGSVIGVELSVGPRETVLGFSSLVAHALTRPPMN